MIISLWIKILSLGSMREIAAFKGLGLQLDSGLEVVGSYWKNKHANGPTFIAFNNGHLFLGNLHQSMLQKKEVHCYIRPQGPVYAKQEEDGVMIVMAIMASEDEFNHYKVNYLPKIEIQLVNTYQYDNREKMKQLLEKVLGQFDEHLLGVTDYIENYFGKKTPDRQLLESIESEGGQFVTLSGMPVKKDEKIGFKIKNERIVEVGLYTQEKELFFGRTQVHQNRLLKYNLRAGNPVSILERFFRLGYEKIRNANDPIDPNLKWKIEAYFKISTVFKNDYSNLDWMKKIKDNFIYVNNLESVMNVKEAQSLLEDAPTEGEMQPYTLEYIRSEIYKAISNRKYNTNQSQKTSFPQYHPYPARSISRSPPSPNIISPTISPFVLTSSPQQNYAQKMTTRKPYNKFYYLSEFSSSVKLPLSFPPSSQCSKHLVNPTLPFYPDLSPAKINNVTFGVDSSPRRQFNVFSRQKFGNKANRILNYDFGWKALEWEIRQECKLERLNRRARNGNYRVWEKDQKEYGSRKRTLKQKTAPKENHMVDFMDCRENFNIWTDIFPSLFNPLRLQLNLTIKPSLADTTQNTNKFFFFQIFFGFTNIGHQEEDISRILLSSHYLNHIHFS